MSQTILVVEDHLKTVQLITLYLEKNGYRVLTAHHGRLALELARQAQPDLMVLDLLLPKVDGLDVCRILRAESNIPIIMLTAKTTEADILRGLELGADDYMVKPFSPRELVARIRTVLRRVQDEKQNKRRFDFGTLVIDTMRHEVRLNGEAVYLTPKEFKLLVVLAREPGRAFTRDELVERVFGLAYEGDDRNINSHIMNLRKKFDRVAKLDIETVFGVGYRLSVHAP
jgi:DNA-binding response OmpR family regulator